MDINLKRYITGNKKQTEYNNFQRPVYSVWSTFLRINKINITRKNIKHSLFVSLLCYAFIDEFVKTELIFDQILNRAPHEVLNVFPNPQQYILKRKFYQTRLRQITSINDVLEMDKMKVKN